MATLHTENDHAGVIRYDDGTGRILTIIPGGGTLPTSPEKVKLAEDFRDVWLPDFVGRLLLVRSEKLSPEQTRTLMRDMRDQRVAANAFERQAGISGQAWVESFNGAIEGVQAARFGDRRHENRIAEFLSLVDRLFPAIYEAGEDVAFVALDKATAPERSEGVKTIDIPAPKK